MENDIVYEGWYALYVKPRHEKKIDEKLKANNLESFLPCKTTIKQWSDRKRKVVQPLFPSYIFINVKSKKEFYQALTVHGVFKYLKAGGNYSKIRNIEIDRVRKILRSEEISDIDTVKNHPKIGKKITVKTGVLCGLECEVLKVNKSKKIIVRIESLNQSLIATVPLNYL